MRNQELGSPPRAPDARSPGLSDLRGRGQGRVHRLGPLERGLQGCLFDPGGRGVESWLVTYCININNTLDILWKVLSRL